MCVCVCVGVGVYVCGCGCVNVNVNVLDDSPLSMRGRNIFEGLFMFFSIKGRLVKLKLFTKAVRVSNLDNIYTALQP